MDKTEELRKILGSEAKDKTEEDLKNEITKLELFAEYLLDFSEKEIFSGHTFLELVSNLLSKRNNYSS